MSRPMELLGDRLAGNDSHEERGDAMSTPPADSLPSGQQGEIDAEMAESAVAMFAEVGEQRHRLDQREADVAERERRADLRDRRADDRDRQADLRDKHADLRDRRADHRDCRADDRDRQADYRDREADQREWRADQREINAQIQPGS